MDESNQLMIDTLRDVLNILKARLSKDDVSGLLSSKHRAELFAMKIRVELRLVQLGYTGG